MTVETVRLRGIAGLVLTLMLLPLGSCAQDEEGPPAEPESRAAPPSAESTPSPGTVLRIDFDDTSLSFDGVREFPAEGGSAIGLVETANGGAVEVKPGAPGHGRAVSFPAVCTEPNGCPRALVGVEHSAEMDPGEADFSYGASVMLTADQTAKGSNIVQKGRFGSAGGQWKLQVDTLDGKPSCVVRGVTASVSVRYPKSIADGEWHQLSCTKDSSGLSIEVDEDEAHAPEQAGAVSNDLPIRIGSPGVGDKDDQFHGLVDEVFVRIMK